MSVLSDLRYRLRALFHREALEDELDAELRFHLEREAEKHVRAGVAPEEAMRRARADFGGLERIKDDSRDARGLSLLETVSRDVRYALRGLRQKPGFAAAIILTLGLGIGANTAMFGVVDRLLFRVPAYLSSPERVHRVFLVTTDQGRTLAQLRTGYTRYLDLRRWTTSIEEMAAFRITETAVRQGEEIRETVVGTASASFFNFFDARPAIGRFFDAADDRVPIGAPVVVLSHAYWLTHYGGRPDVLGTRLQVGTILCTVIGVAPRGFAGTGDGKAPEIWIPITTYAGSQHWFPGPSDYYTLYQRGGWLELLVRRRPGVGLEAANADLTAAYLRSWAADRELNPTLLSAEVLHPHAIAAPYRLARGLEANGEASRDARVVVWVSGVALIVLVIACANVANLLLARALLRRREIAVRLALGISRRRLLGQLLTESLLLAALGGLAGVLIAQWGGAVLRRLFVPEDPSLTVVSDQRTLVFAAAITLIVGVLTGVAPALQAGRDDLAAMIKAGAREGTHQRSRTRTALLVGQGALSVILLVGAGLFMRSLSNVRAMRLGYDIDPVLYVSRSYNSMTLSRDEQLALAKRLDDAARQLPGVTNVTRAITFPFSNTWVEDLYVEGVDSVQQLGMFTLQSASPEYFQTTGTRILRGRGIMAQDRAGAPPVAVVSEAMARRLWPGKDAIGQCFRVGTDTVPCTTVVGIAENIKENSLTDDEGLHYVLPLDQFPTPRYPDLFVRTRGDAAGYAGMVRRQLQPLMPGGSYVTVTPLRDIIDSEQQSWRSGATMFLAFGSLALVLAAIGLYSVIAYSVAQRTQELGVRIALGAGAGDVLRLVVGEGIRLAVVGIAIGGAVALVAGRWAEPLLFAESPRDPLVFGAVGALLFGVAVVASAVPALRASHVDPNVALRAE